VPKSRRIDDLREGIVKLAPGRLRVAAFIACWFGLGSPAWADWATCQSKPTQDCILDEAFRGSSGPVTGKERLDVMIAGGVLAHPEWANAADIAEAQRLARSTTDVSGIYYILLTIHGLVADKQKQQAIDFVGGLPSARQTTAITELARELAKAGDAETALALPDRMQPPLDEKAVVRIRYDVIAATIKALAESGKTDQALMLLADQKYLTEATIADLQTAVGQAFAKRGDTKLADGAFDQAGRNLEAARKYNVTPSADIQIRFASIRVLALRGKVDAVNAALQDMRSSAEPGASDASLSYERTQGYQRVVAALLDAKQPEAALTLANSLTPNATKDIALAAVGSWQASNGHFADARALLASIGNVQETFARSAVLRTLAISTAKEGDVASGLKLVGELRNAQQRQGTLFAIAHVMPH
jgi:hypothetical protein